MALKPAAFCRARVQRPPAVGQRIFFLSGIDIGQIAVRSAQSSPHLRQGQFLVEMDHLPGGTHRVVSLYYDIFIADCVGAIPAWMPPLSMEDAFGLHEAMLMAIDQQRQNSNVDGSTIRPMVSRCWWGRLPVDPEESWAMAAAHGFQALTQGEFVRLFGFGIEVLNATLGRTAIARKRMKPLSQARYLTKRQREFRLQMFGHD